MARIGVLKERWPKERRVALVPSVVPDLTKKGFEVWVERGAGSAAGYSDDDYAAKGATLASSRDEVLSADILAQVFVVGLEAKDLGREGPIIEEDSIIGRDPGVGSDSGVERASGPKSDLAKLGAKKLLVGFADPLGRPEHAQAIAQTGATLVAMELVPRITRSQAMDALSSMATISGYKAVIYAAERLPRMFPMMMTAAGTVTPARVFVLGAGVAGLQACATAKRLGAVVRAYDVRSAVKEQVESVGAKFVEVAAAPKDAEDAGGYAKVLSEDFYAKQRETMSAVIADSDVVITTALVPGQKAVVLITEAMVSRMARGSVIVDLAAERGGNCELTKPEEDVDFHGVSILGPTNVPSTVPYHASQMYARNVVSLLGHLFKRGAADVGMTPDFDDEITRSVVVTHEGRIVHARVREALDQGARKETVGGADEARPSGQS